ncbi:sn-glycerol-1-phosphate dehydrogenase [Clostridium tyrobutyricum]|uniref:sn-glycerol-1-phosphate dehydrogenase n=1 Tax=Clostridium tyrobutyricum TaxID=1519 RepID=UPI002B21AE5C|nr:sn-glycerol-1-phosphate dehydrogenase [Clostridium tyrobutyricum]MEA5008665.1 sn-glycerol-1-phosphate dehydrogenase [Clostridium tyrobutyricum]
MKLTIENVSRLQLNDFLKNHLECQCGKNHSIGLEDVIVEEDAIKKIPDLLKKYKFNKMLIVSDSHTYDAAGKLVEETLKKNNFRYKQYVFKVEEDLVPNEEAVGKLLIQVDEDIDAIVTVGTGTLNDLSKFISHKLKIPSIIVGTAPSMDGFASNGSALIVGNLKITYDAAVPKAIIGDINVLKESPKDMILAGFGDIVGKYSALNDWKLSKVINGEYYCDVTVKMVEDSLKRCIDNAEGIKDRDSIAVKNLMEALVLTGIAMSFVGNSRPASGSEHHLAHYFEMMLLFENKKAILHGRKVGVNTVITTKLREMLAKEDIDFDKAVSEARSFDITKWTEKVNSTFKEAANGIVEISKKDGITSIEKRIERIGNIKEHEDEVKDILKQIPSSEQIKKILIKSGAPVLPEQIGIKNKYIFNAIVMSKEIRTRYTILSLLSDLGLLEEFSHSIEKYLEEVSD